MSRSTLPKKPVDHWEQIRDEWVVSVEKAIQQAKTWSESRGWAVRVLDKPITEDRLGSYVVPYLLIQVGTESLLLDPLARFVPGCEGALDLYVRPYYDATTIVRLEDGRWQIRPSDPESAPSGWSKASFLKAVAALLRPTG